MEETWPGITSLPAYKCNFPKWKDNILQTVITDIDDDALDLLNAMLIYDPQKRLSAILAINHPYFNEKN